MPNDSPKIHPGQPTLYRPEFCDEILELGRMGRSVVQFACHFNVVKQTLFNWADMHPEFLDAFTRAKQLSQEWWENLAQAHMVETFQGPKLNTGLWSRSMAARFPDDYREKSAVELTGADGGPIKQQVIQDAVRAATDIVGQLAAAKAAGVTIPPELDKDSET